MIFSKNESKSVTGLDRASVEDIFPVDSREAYVLKKLNDLKIGTRLIEFIDRGSIIVITKLSNDRYEFNYGEVSNVHSIKIVVLNILEDHDSIYNLPKAVKLVPGSRIKYDDDYVKVFNENRKIYEGIEDDEPMKKEDWRYNKYFGLYYIYSSSNVYYKIKV